MSSYSAHASPDRRIQRTRQVLSDAFLSLLAEKEFADIVVKDITEKANVNRSTFYAHYPDKFELLESLSQEKLHALIELTNTQRSSEMTRLPPFDEVDPYFVALFEHLAQHDHFYSIMLTKTLPSNPSFAQRMLEAIRDHYYVRITSSSSDQKLLVPLDILLDYISASVMGMIRKWLEHRMIYTPRYMALQLTRLSLLGTYKAMGMDE